MKSSIEKQLNEVSKLDSWDIQSILGGVNYIVQQAAINQVVRLIPELPEPGSGLENFTAWEQAMKAPSINETVSPIIGVADRVKDILREYTDMQISEYADVLQFMLTRPPQRATFEAEYNNRKRLGMRPSMPMSTFVDMEYAQAMQRHAALVAKGEAAVKILDGMQGSDAEAPEWLYDAVDTKVLQKLEQRWMRAELRRTNPKIVKDQRDLAEANQRMIEAVITELGGSPPKFDEQMAAADDMDAFVEKTKAMVAANTPQT